MICFICGINIGDLQALVIHYKIIHLLKPDSAYSCLENSCTQSFQSLSSFKRHVTKKHLVYNLTSENIHANDLIKNNSNEIKNNDSAPVAPDINQHLEECINESYEPEVTFNFEKSVKLLYDSTAQFVVSLYNNNNFNRSDVLYIQTGVIENILKPIASILKTVVKKQIVEPVLLSTFDNIVGIILNPFFHCSTYRIPLE